MSEPIELRHLVVIPFIDCWEMTREAIGDALGQSVEPVVLAIDNGSGREAREAIDVLASKEERLLVWHHDPPLPSLSATWNAALCFAWASKLDAAMVCNNDVKLAAATYELLLDALRMQKALLVSAVGVAASQFSPDPPAIDFSTRGGPDFSCYLISRECHERFPFDEQFVPAYCEDLDLHRRIMLAGEGDRIFSVNLPFWHREGGSGTLKSWDAKRRTRFERAVETGSRSHYKRKWGGAVNEETYRWPFGRKYTEEDEITPECPDGCVTTPQLQAHGCGGKAERADGAQHPVGCVCESCSAAHERERRDPRG